MAKVASIESRVFSSRMSIYAKLMKSGILSINTKSASHRKSCQLSELSPDLIEKANLKSGEFLVRSQNTLKPIIEEVRKANTFIDTAKRIADPNNQYCEVWKLRTEHIDKLKEELTHDQAPSEHQPEHRGESG